MSLQSDTPYNEATTQRVVARGMKIAKNVMNKILLYRLKGERLCLSFGFLFS